MKKNRIRRPKKNPFTQRLSEIPLTDEELEQLEKNLSAAIILGYVEDLIEAIQITKTGIFCTDCKRNSLECICEKCLDCRLSRCLCKYNIKRPSSDIEYYMQASKIRNLAWNFAKYIYSPEQVLVLKTDILLKLRNYSRSFNKQILKIIAT